jgi:hypothetical protein
MAAGTRLQAPLRLRGIAGARWWTNEYGIEVRGSHPSAGSGQAPSAQNAEEWGSLSRDESKGGPVPDLGLITSPEQNQIAHSASPPTLAKNARMGHPQCEWCMRKSLRIGQLPTKSNSARSVAAHPCKERKDGAPSVGMMHAKNVKAGYLPYGR